MEVKVNGKPECISVDNLAIYLQEKGLDLKTVVVEHNGQVVKAERWANTLLREGDQLELLSFVGGG